MGKAGEFHLSAKSDDADRKILARWLFVEHGHEQSHAFGVVIAAVDQKTHASVTQRIKLRHELFARHKIRQHIPPFYGRLTDPICQLFFKCQHRARPTSTARAGAG